MLLSKLICLAFLSTSVLSLNDESILSPFTMWSLSETTLPVPSREVSPVYDESFDPDSIYMLAGGGCTTCIWRYNITSNSISLYDTLENTQGTMYAAWTTSVLINGTIYWLENTATGSDLYKYDILNKNDSVVTAFNGTGIYTPCLTTYPNNNNAHNTQTQTQTTSNNKNELYIQGGSGSSYCENSTQFYIYDMDTQTTKQGPELFGSRWGPTCMINNAYLYVFGGCSTYIERINVETLDSWYLLTTRLDDVTAVSNGNSAFDFTGFFAYFGAIQYKNYILLMNGWDEWNDHEHELFLFDCDTSKIEYFGEFPQLAWATAPIIAQNRVFVFGGATTYEGWQDTIWISEEIINTAAPTQEPTQIPTIKPSNGPTSEPSSAPTNEPSNKPSSAPSGEPSGEPTNKPSLQPSIFPSELPTGSPTEMMSVSSTSSAPEVQTTSVVSSIVESVETTVAMSAQTTETFPETSLVAGETGETVLISTDGGNSGSGGSLNSNNSDNDDSAYSSNDVMMIVSICVGVVVCLLVVFLCVFCGFMRYFMKEKANSKAVANAHTSHLREIELQLQKMPLTKAAAIAATTNATAMGSDNSMINGANGSNMGHIDSNDVNSIAIIRELPSQPQLRPVLSLSGTPRGNVMSDANIDNNMSELEGTSKQIQMINVSNGNEDDTVAIDDLFVDSASMPMNETAKGMRAGENMN